MIMKQTEAFNDRIASAVKAAGEIFFAADLFHSRLNNDCYDMNTLDGLHPDEDGMRMIAEVVEEAIKKNFKEWRKNAEKIQRSPQDEQYEGCQGCRKTRR